MAYTPTTWVNDVTALNATRMNNIESGVDNTDQALTDHLADTTDAHDASAISVLDSGAFLAATNVEAALAELFTLFQPIYPAPATTLPGSPANGDVAILTDSTSNPTYQWVFRYHSGSSNTDKWEFLGGAPGYSTVATAEQTTSTSYAALTTAGPSFALPVAGVYDIEIGFTGGNSAVYHLMSYDIGATGAVDGDSVRQQNAGSAGSFTSVHRVQRKTGLTAVTLTAKYKSSAAGTSEFSARYMRVTPVRVS